MRLKDKVAVLTGGASGMGEAHARRIIEEGAKLVFTDILVEAGEALALELGENALFIAQDVAKEEDWDRVVSAACERFGGIDILVNNAGIHSYGALHDETAEKLRRVLDVNVVSAWLGTQKVSPSMIERGGGSIVNLSSLAGLRGLPNYSIYGCSKWAMRGVTRHLAIELAPLNIRINAILPGAIDATGMFNSKMSPHANLELKKATPLRRFGSREDVSSLVVYLASDESSFTTGADHVIDGGKSL